MSRVSVVVPVHNRRALIGEAIDSALGQTLPPLEVIVVDDGSTDGAAEMLTHRYGARIRVERLERNVGRSAARNHGWRAAHGDLVAFLDSDDRWLPDKLARQVPLFDDPEVGLVHGYAGKMNRDGLELPRETDKEMAFFEATATRGYDYGGITLTWTAMYTSAVVMRRGLLEHTGGFDERTHVFEDWDLFWRAVLVQRVATVRDLVFVHRVHPGNTHTTWEAAAPPWLRLNEKHLAILEEYRDAQFHRRARRNLLANVALGHFWANRPRESRWWMVRALATSPSFLRGPARWAYGAPFFHALLPKPLAEILVRATGVDRYHKSVTLVVDDGPSSATPHLLDALEAAGHRAILFVLGCNVAGREDVLEDAIRRGFALGNHSWNHPRFSGISLQEAREEIARTEGVIDTLYARVGMPRPRRYFRFPYLDTGGEHHEALQRLLREMGFSAGHFQSTVVTEDWRRPSERALRRRLRAARPGSVVEFHDKPDLVERYLSVLTDELGRLGLRAALPPID